jgi:hypothetical protein
MPHHLLSTVVLFSAILAFGANFVWAKDLDTQDDSISPAATKLMSKGIHPVKRKVSHAPYSIQFFFKRVKDLFPGQSLAG